jgi:hypothetical protein
MEIQGMKSSGKIIRIALLLILCTFTYIVSRAQAPVFQPSIDVDQKMLLQGCLIATDVGCHYSLKDVLNSGGDFWTTPFQPYDPATKTGDGYGEGASGPRAKQRKAFNPNTNTKNYPYLRLNGLDSQSCFECHNSTGSHVIDLRGAMIRKPSGVAGSAGSNSNAFINPLYPDLQTLFIRNPPAVFGSGYQQAVGDEMTDELFVERDLARLKAKLSPGTLVTQQLSAKFVSFGTFTTKYVANSPAKVIADPNSCPAASNATNIGGKDGYTEDVTGVQGVSCDLVIRPFQWKGVSSSLRHFVRDALDFHFSMQAFEKVAMCDCDGDGKGTPSTGPEVTIGQVTAMVAFVGMTRPPVQLPIAESSSAQQGGYIFLGLSRLAGETLSPTGMCARCHVANLPLGTPQMLVEWPTNATDESAPPIDPDNPATWPISPTSCPNGAPSNPATCPMESAYGAGGSEVKGRFKNLGALVSPSISSESLTVVKRYNANKVALDAEPNLLAAAAGGSAQMDAIIRRLRAPLVPKRPNVLTTDLSTGSAATVVGQDYVIPLTIPDANVTAAQLPRLPVFDYTGRVLVPLFSDLKRHNMGSALSDPVGMIPGKSSPIPTQGTDVNGIVTTAQEFMTRPLWGVADTGPWLHDGRALTLRDAILMHGDSKTGGGSEAAPVIDAFEKLSPSDQQAVVDFLLTLRLPLPGNVDPSAVPSQP